MKWRHVIILCGFIWTQNSTSAQNSNANIGPQFGFARPLEYLGRIDPDPFGTDLTSGPEANLDALSNVSLDFLGRMSMMSPNFSLENTFENITPQDAPANDGLFSSRNSLNDIMLPEGLIDFQLPPGTNGDDFSENNTHPTLSLSLQSAAPTRPEINSVMPLSVPSSFPEIPSILPVNQPNRNANTILPQTFLPEPSPAADSNPRSPSSASAVIKDWLSITTDSVQKRHINNPVMGRSPNTQPTFTTFTNRLGDDIVPGNQLANNIASNRNERTGNATPNNSHHLNTIDMWSHNSLFNNPNLGEPSDVFGNMNIPMNFPIEGHAVQSTVGRQQTFPSTSVEISKDSQVSSTRLSPQLSLNMRNVMNRQLWNQPKGPLGLPLNPNRREPRVNKPPLFKIGGGPPSQLNQINPADKIDPLNEQILIRDVFRDSSVPTQSNSNRIIHRSQNRRRNVVINRQPLARPTPINIQRRQQIFTDAQQVQQATSSGLTSFSQPLPTQRFPQFRNMQRTLVNTDLMNTQLRPLPANTIISTPSNSPLRPNPKPPIRINPAVTSSGWQAGRRLTQSRAVGNRDATRFISDQRNMNTNMQIWSRIEDRAQNVAGQSTAFTVNQRSNPILGLSPQFRRNQRLPDSLLRGLPVPIQRQQVLRNFSPTPRPSPFGPPPPAIRFQSLSQFSLNENRFRNPSTQSSSTTEQVLQQQRRGSNFQIETRRSNEQGEPPFAPLLFLSLHDSLQDLLDLKLLDNFDDDVLLFLQDLNVPQPSNLFNPSLDISDRRSNRNQRRLQFPREQVPNRMVVDLPFNQQSNNPFGMQEISPPVSPVLMNEDAPFIGSGFFNPRMMMLADVEVKPSSKKRIKPVSKQNATKKLLQKANMQGLRLMEFINTPVVKENRVY